ncbi:MAG: hypothetical protein UX30_C0004G0034 [Candidatus Saccharibacteria bacterium GW2011_GWA2_46_10]|nr:MAG: hypothetical protein UX30_C0004G0034 [Candidatus Saccharibacteria bacterium GW2011_GWA2_46_10]
MGVTVQTGHTKSASGLSLVSLKMKSNLKEDVVVLLHIQAETAEAKTLEKECTAVIKNSLLETEGDAGERLDGTLKEINGLIKGFVAAKKIEDVHAIIAVAGADGMLNVSHAGRAEAYIVRGGTASQITEYTRGKPLPAFVHIASGEIEPRDTAVFSTQRLLRTMTPAQLAKLAHRGDQLMDEIIFELEAEKEKAALAAMRRDDKGKKENIAPSLPLERGRNGRRGKFKSGGAMEAVSGFAGKGADVVKSLKIPERFIALSGKVLSVLKQPKKNKKTHLLILAGLVAVFLAVWAGIKLATSAKNSQSRAELEQIIVQIGEDIRTAENRFLVGDTDSANAVLERARERAKQVMDNESGRFRMEALDLLDKIRLKDEEINNIVRLSPRVVVNLSSKNPDVSAVGLVGIKDGELAAFDKQDVYRVLLNAVENPDRVSETDLISGGSYFERMQTILFQTSSNSILEIIEGQVTPMKTEDQAGWKAGNAVNTYLRFLYILSAESNQIYKYERLSNRYSPPAEYNINGDLSSALDFAIDGNVFVLKEGGEVVKLFRGETRPFSVRNLPSGALKDANKVFKAPEEGNIYFLDPAGSRVIVVTDGGPTGESAYVRQYILVGEQIGELKDLYVDPEQLHLYVLDSKRIYAIDLGAR